MVKNLPRVGVILQLIFFILFFGAILPEVNNILGAITCLMIGLVSLFIGTISVKKQIRPNLSIVVIIISVIILGFTIFAYFIGEGGQPPLIMQKIYNEHVRLYD